MGNYIVKADILEQLPEDTLIQLTDDENLGTVNDARVDAAINDAEGEADGYLSTRYTVPLSPAPASIKKFTADIAIYNLFGRRDTVPPDREKRYENAIKFLVNVSKGIVTLGAQEPEPTTTAGSVEFTSNERTFTRSKLEGF